MTTLYDLAEQVRRSERQRLEDPQERRERDYGDVVDEAYARHVEREIERERAL